MILEYRRIPGHLPFVGGEEERIKKISSCTFSYILQKSKAEGGKGYEQILASGLVYWHKQSIIGTDVFLLLSHEV